MFETVTSADQVLAGALAAAQEPDALLRALEEIPAPIYVTDAQGFVTYFNQSCIGFAGRNPQAGKDRWCVTWKLFTEDGKFLPHDQCPMADSIRRREKVRGLTALAERPDGTRMRFMPFPTPIFSESGEFQGAINMLIDITEDQQAAGLRAQAERCRRLAAASGDDAVYKTLHRLASQYEVKAIALELLPPN